MKINWNIRWKNPVWWAETIAALFAPILAYAGMAWEQMTSWAAIGNLLAQAVQNPVVVVAVLVAAFNALTDPTTPTLNDSERAMNYIEPGVPASAAVHPPDADM